MIDSENKQRLLHYRKEAKLSWDINQGFSTTGGEMLKFSEVVHMKHRHLLLEQP